MENDNDIHVFSSVGNISSGNQVLKSETAKKRAIKEAKARANSAVGDTRTMEDKILFLKKYEVELIENRLQKRLKSNIQSYDIRDSVEYAGALEIEKLLQTKLAKDSRSVDISAAFKDLIKAAT